MLHTSSVTYIAARVGLCVENSAITQINWSFLKITNLSYCSFNGFLV
jgi:hypothetical protein